MPLTHPFLPRGNHALEFSVGHLHSSLCILLNTHTSFKNIYDILHVQFNSVHFRHLVMSGPLWPNGLQHARLHCPSPIPGACSNSCPLSWWYHPTISSSVVPFSTCLQSFPASGSLPMNRLLASGGQSIGTSASASVLPMNIQGWFPLGLIGLISLLSKGL